MHVVLYQPEIPPNTGSVGRLCAATEVSLHLVGPLGFELDDKHLKRAGLDYWKHVAPVVHADFAEFEGRLDSLGTPLFFSAEAEQALYDVEIADDAVFVFGKESVGFSGPIRERYRDSLVRIPQFSDAVRSINVSTCVGIALYEAVRRRG